MDFKQNLNKDMDIAEQNLRANAEQSIRDYKVIMSEVAFRFAGKLMEEFRRSDPNAPKIWNPDQWKKFWEEANNPVIKEKKVITWNQAIAVNTLGDMESAMSRIRELEDELSATKSELETVCAEFEQLRESYSQVKQAYKDSDIQLKELRRILKTTQEELNRVKAARNMNAANKGQNSNKQQKENQAQTEEIQDALPPLFMEQMAVEVGRVCKEVRKPPLRFEGRLAYGIQDWEIRYKRQLMALFLMANYGLCIRREIERIIAFSELTSSRSKTVKKVIDELEESRLAATEVLNFEGHYATSQPIVRLTDDGKELCSLFEWKIVESEWTRLEKFTGGHKGHLFANILMTMNARARGWETVIVSDVDGLLIDNVIFKAGQLHYTTYIDGELDLDKLIKIKELSPDNRVSIYTFDPNNRKAVIEICKQHKLKGVATDLQNLIFDDKGKARQYFQITQQEPLWLEEWD